MERVTLHVLGKIMTPYKAYVLILCLIVFVMLTTVFTAMMTALTRQALRLINVGAEDEKIYKEYAKRMKRGERKAGKVLDTLFSVLLCAVFALVFGFSLYVNLSGDKYFDNIPTLKVVESDSMSQKHEVNTYLTENNLNDQFDTFDLVLVYKAPAQEDLKLYDIVVYEIEHGGEKGYIIHRIVGIEEPNKDHPDERWFKMQGDAVARPDASAVKYSQIKGIYRGEHLPFVGSFIMFMQSPAGWMCMLLMLAATIATPIIDKKLERERQKRICVMLHKNRAQADKQPPICYFPVYYNPAYGIPFTSAMQHAQQPSAPNQDRRGR